MPAFFVTLIGLGALLVQPLALAKPQAVDAAGSVVQWTGKKIGGEHTGKVMITSGTVDLEKGTGEVVVDMTSITNEDLSGEWRDKLMTHLKSEDFFAVDKFNTAKLTFKKIQKKGTVYSVTGDLNIKGKSAPVKFDVTENAGKYEGTLSFDRTKYGITYRSGSLFKDLGDKLIHDQVDLRFTIALKPFAEK